VWRIDVASPPIVVAACDERAGLMRAQPSAETESSA
jgi:hypothetical protein